MAACPEAGARKRRYAREPVSGPVALAGPKAELLGYVAGFAPVSLPQLALLVGLSPKATRRHLRVLFDAGVVELLPAPREQLATPAGRAAHGGSAPNLYGPTPAGLRALRDAGLAEGTGSVRCRHEPRGGYFLAHTLAVTDVRVWLVRCARRRPEHALERWCSGEEASVALPLGAPARALRPDAWFAYRLGPTVLAAAVEVDRGTERGDRRWAEKAAAYGALFELGLQHQGTGYRNARVLVTAPDHRRRDGLTERIYRLAPPGLAERFWVTAHGTLGSADLEAVAWARPGVEGLHSLVPTGLLARGKATAAQERDGFRHAETEEEP